MYVSISVFICVRVYVCISVKIYNPENDTVKLNSINHEN